MPATVTIREITGPTTDRTYTIKGTADPSRYCTDDNPNPGLDYPIPIPQTDVFHYSYWKSHCLHLSGTYTRINNVRWYSSGNPNWTFGVQGEVRVAKRDSGDNGCPDAQYAQASGTRGVTGYPIEDSTNGHPYYRTQGTPTVKIGTYTSGTPMLVDSANYDGETTVTKHVVTQVRVDRNEAVQGQQPNITLTFLWDEI